MTVIKFARTKAGAVVPTKRDCDAGYDIYACFSDPYVVIDAHETMLIPTGIATEFSTDYVAIIKERGSTGTRGLGQRSGVIEGSYQGEWFVPITNHNAYPIIILKEGYDVWEDAHLMEFLGKDRVFMTYPYEKAIAQFIMLPVPKFTGVTVPYEEILATESERGTGALGSSGK